MLTLWVKVKPDAKLKRLVVLYVIFMLGTSFNHSMFKAVLKFEPANKVSASNFALRLIRGILKWFSGENMAPHMQ